MAGSTRSDALSAGYPDRSAREQREARQAASIESFSTILGSGMDKSESIIRNPSYGLVVGLSVLQYVSRCPCCSLLLYILLPGVVEFLHPPFAGLS